MVDHDVDDPNPLRNYVCCLDNPPVGATHLCVIQDDTVPCRRFGEALDAVVAARPDDPISLFVGGLSNRTTADFRRAQISGSPWSQVNFRDIHHVVAVVWPVGLAASFLAWLETAHVPTPKPMRSDDMVVGYWARTTRRQFWATVPCLVEHPDDTPSTIRARAWGRGDRGRQAVHWIGDGDPLDTDWSVG